MTDNGCKIVEKKYTYLIDAEKKATQLKTGVVSGSLYK